MEFLIAIWNNLYPTILGAVLISIATFLKKVHTNRQIYRKYPVGGEYITVFEDIVGGALVKQYAYANLVQEGFSIKGTTDLGSRRWNLTGNISQNGYVYGIYSAEHYADDGIGNFILQIKSSERLEGIWSGYDSVNKKIVSGGYRFMKTIPVNVGPLRKEQLYRAVDIIDSELGKDYVRVSELRNLMEDDSYVCIVATAEDAIVGVAIGCVKNTPDALAYLRITENDLPSYAKIAEQIAVIKTVAVAADYQGRGVGSKMVEYLEKQLARDSGVLSSVAWKHGDTVNIANLLERHGYKKRLEIADYWKEDSLTDGFYCPICKQPPCTCSAVVYFKSI